MNGSQRKYTVDIHDDAAQMLYSHVRFLANVNVAAARKLSDSLHKACASLKLMPHRCPIYRTRRALGTYRRLIVGRYQVIFSIDEKKSIVNIQYILDSRQNNDI